MDSFVQQPAVPSPRPQNNRTQKSHGLALWTIWRVNTPRLWDIFCKVVDNYGDIGVCWRLSADLAARGQRVRLWVDDPSALAWMAPEGCQGVEVRAWTQPLATDGLGPGDVLIEAFGCEIAREYIANYAHYTRARGIKHLWINLEYLSAEAFVVPSHGLPSPVMSGPGAGLMKHFFYPGFTPGTGGLLREPDLLHRQARFERDPWLKHLGITVNQARGERLVSLFCYEPVALNALLQQLANDATPTRLLVTPGRAAQAVLTLLESKNRLSPLWNVHSQLLISYLPLLTQHHFDELLWACDLNFVRGEDSLVRAIWAGKPFVWQIYPQHDGAHHAKLNAFLDWMQAPPSLRRFSRQWNGMHRALGESSQNLPFDAAGWAQWGDAAQKAQARLLAQTDLVTQLLLAFRP